jgi:DNA-binding phage protein
MYDDDEDNDFDPVDYLRSEVAFEEYIITLREEGASEALMEEAYRDIERARIVYGIPKPEPELVAV